MGIKLDLSGRKIGRLSVVKEIKNAKVVLWECRCDCGNSIEVRTASLNSKTRPTQSCGCLQLETAKKQGYKNYKGKNTANINSIFSKYKNRAEKKKLVFSISKERFLELIKEKCYYCEDTCKATHVRQYTKEEFKYNGIDRVDSSIGYIEGNIVTCCKQCNVAKSDYSKEEFLDMVAKIYKRHINEQ